MIDAGVAIGEIFLEKYRVDAFLGHGGMGVVASCTHLALNERVAIKMLRRDVIDDADAVERFMREAQAASKLKSEYVARVTDVGRSPTNVPYMIMEYLEGHDLGELLSERGSIGMPWAIELTLQACEALAEAHSIGIVHRDIKPTNLFVTWRPDGSALVKVLDFGISKAMTASSLQLTQTQSLLGTPAYMSPEQMRSARQVDARTDIWSLGTVLYELLEGRRPFEAESFSEMCIKVAVDSPAPMTKAPPSLQQVVLRCLAKTPEHRYASMADLGADLVAFSHDPHQAQVLVERMTRTLRRSQIADWDPALASGASLRPAPPSAIARGSDPTFPVLNALPPDDQLPSQTLVVPRRGRRGWWVAVAVTVAATLGVIISFTHDTPPTPTVRTRSVLAPIAEPHAAGAEASTSQAKTTEAADPAAPVTPPTEGGGEPAGADNAAVPAETGAAAVAADDSDIELDPAPTRRTGDASPSKTRRNGKPTDKSSRDRRRARPSLTAPAPAANKKCNPFDDPHGCPQPATGSSSAPDKPPPASGKSRR